MTGKEYAFYDRTARLKQAMPLSGLMMVASCFLWVAIFYVIYYAVSLSTMYARIIQENDIQSPCKEPFSDDAKVNFRKTESYPKGVAGPYIVRFAPKKGSHAAVENDNDDDGIPTIVTAVSSAQFYQVQGLIDHLDKVVKPQHPMLRLVIYDVGLYSKEHYLLEKYCAGCEIRRFITSAYPQHVADFSNYAWRPIIMQSALDEFGSIMYLSPTARFKSSASLKTIKNRGWRDFMVWDLPTHVDIIAYTAPETFHYLGEDRCAFKEAGMISMEIMVLFKSNNTWNLLMKPWLKCAFSAECITPPGSRLDLCFHMRRPRTTGCHSYDQSAISIVLNRVLQVTIDRDRFIPPRITYTSEEEVTLFPEQPWTNTQICILLLLPVLIYVIWIVFVTSGRNRFR